MPTPEHERARILWYIDVILIRYDVNDPANHTEHGQCGDERIDVETGDHDAVDEADDEPSERSDNDRRERTGAGVAHHDRCDHPSETEDRTHRDIDASC